jgi:hypothetical protein
MLIDFNGSAERAPVTGFDSNAWEDMKLERSEAQKLIDAVLRDVPRDDCRTCDCFLGFVTRLELDSQEE